MRQLVSKNSTSLSVRKQCKVLGINRSQIYLKPKSESQENIEVMHLMDNHNIDHPDEGVQGMRNMLRDNTFIVNHKRIRRLMHLMDIKAIYPQRNLTQIAKGEYKYPYLLRGLVVDRPNQVWSIDITYIPMANGFMYLTAIIDVYSRFIVGWHLGNSLEAQVSATLLEEAITRYGKPEIVNSDQGSQYTSHLWVDLLKINSIKISMDGKGRATDNIWIERFWRTIKRGYIYLNPTSDGIELYHGIKGYIEYYNYIRGHSVHGGLPPYTEYGVQRPVDIKTRNMTSKYRKIETKINYLQVI